MCNAGEDAATPLSDLLAAGEEGGLDDLEEEKAHVVLLHHLLDDEVHPLEPVLHQSLYGLELSLNPLYHHMCQVVAVVAQQRNRLVALQSDAPHQF